MNIIFITLPDFFDGETAAVNALFAHGMQRLHLRKPKATREEMITWIEQIEPAYRSRIVLHDHHELAQEYQLGGIHLNSRNPEAPEWAADIRRERPFTLSRSCHSIEELSTLNSPLSTLDYVTLSPIFDSISKEGYGAAFSRQALAEARRQGLLTDQVYALGGVARSNLNEVKELGFKGAAVLGDLWLCRPFSTEMLLQRLQEFMATDQ